MTLAWKSDLASGPKMVLLALCDNANDQGECYPSVPMIAQKCSMGVRTVQQHINDMEAAGIVSRDMRTGRSTIYRIDPRRICTPAESAPPQNSHHTPAKSAPPPPQNLHPTPAESAPITIKEPSIEPSRNRKRAPAAPAEQVALPDWLPTDAWSGYLDMRQTKKKIPTDHAVRLILADLAKWRAAGHDVATILNTSTMNGWTAVYEPKTPPAAVLAEARQAQPAATRARRPQGNEPKGTDESYDQWQTRVAAFERAQRQGAQA
jgi:hypothetical protein